MKSIRIGNDFIVLWKLNRGSKPENLSLANNFTLTLYKRIFGRDGIKVPYSIVNNNTIKVEITPEIADINGNYYFKVGYNLNDSSLSDNEREVRRDVAAFQIVPRTFQSDDVYEVTVVTNILSDDTGVEVVKPPITKAKSDTIRRIRKGNDFVFEWRITRSDEPEKFSRASNIKLFQYCKRFGENKKEITNYTIRDGFVSIDITSEIVGGTGVYYYELHYEMVDYSLSTNKKGCVVDVSAFQIVERTSHADDVFKITTATSIDPTANYENIEELLDYLISQLNFDKKYLSKINDDVAKGRITFEQGIESLGLTRLYNTYFGNFQSGMHAGQGGAIDSAGNAELESMVLRSFLEVPTIRYNELEYIGEEIIIGAGAVLKGVEHLGDDRYRLTLKLEDGQLNPFRPSDLLKGIYNMDEEGNFTGFGTTYVSVSSIDEHEMIVILADESGVVGDSNMPPRKFMHLARIGNFTDTDRQSYISLSAKDRAITQYGGVNAFAKKNKQGKNVRAGVVTTQWGRAEGLEFIENWDYLPVTKDSDVLYTNTLLYNKQIKVDYEGIVIKEYIDRGQWFEGMECQVTETTIDEVWIEAEKFRLIDRPIENDPFVTTEKPTRESEDWTLILSIKDDIEDRYNDLKGELETYADTIGSGLQEQIDGVVNSWFYGYNPTMDNIPAVEWTTAELKREHEGDTFTNTESGVSWRFAPKDGIHQWIEITSSDATLALAMASKAQDTADGKRRVFTVTPQATDTYDVGDLWTNATAGTYSNDLLRCKTPKAVGVAFSISHWEKASKYTDDTKADEALSAINDTIAKVDVEYALGTNSTTAPATGWSTDAPAWEKDKFMWSRMVTYPKVGEARISNTACIQGATGKGITRIDEEYYRSNLPTEMSGGSWSTTVPTPVADKYIWTRSVVYYDDDPTLGFPTNAVMASGFKGADAIAPIIDENGFWAFWNKETETFIPSEFSAIGDDGHAPVIRDGYWYEWNPALEGEDKYQNTDVRAEGVKGDGVQQKFLSSDEKPTKPTGDAVGWNDIPDEEEAPDVPLVPIGDNLHSKSYLISLGWESYPTRVEANSSVPDNIIDPSKFKPNTQYLLEYDMYGESPPLPHLQVKIVYTDSTVEYSPDIIKWAQFTLTTAIGKTVQSIEITKNWWTSIIDGSSVMELGIGPIQAKPIWTIFRNITNGVASEWSEPVKWLGEGTPGKDGKDGADGNDGKDGKDGADGNDGKDGTSVSIKGSKDTPSELSEVSDPALGDGYMINGDLWVYVGGSIHTPPAPVGWNNVGRIKGEKGKDGSSYLVLGYWSPLYEYQQSDAGIPIVKRPGSATFLAYKLIVPKSTQGHFYNSSDDPRIEWELVDSSEFTYMLEAYIEVLQAELITAERIEALDIVHPSGKYSLIDGKLKVQEAEIEGRVTATSGVFSGALASPFDRTKSTYTKEDFSNNLIVTGNFTLPWDQKGSGRLIRLIQPKPVGPLGASCTAPTEKYFYEDGEQKNTLTMVGQEIIELLGYTDSLGEFKGWLVLNRGLLHTASTWGEPHRIVAHGRVNTNDTFNPFKYHTFDGSILSRSTGEFNSRKFTVITMHNGDWFDSIDGYYVKIIANGGDSAAFHTVDKTFSFTFMVYQHSLDVANGTLSPTPAFDFYFEVYSAAWLYPKSGTSGTMPGEPW